MKVNNNDNEVGSAQSAAEDCRILGRQFAYGKNCRPGTIEEDSIPLSNERKNFLLQFICLTRVAA
jgi:hypothetical protein